MLRSQSNQEELHRLRQGLPVQRCNNLLVPVMKANEFGSWNLFSGLCLVTSK